MASLFRLNKQLDSLKTRYNKLNDRVSENILNEINQKLSNAQENCDLFSARISSPVNKFKSIFFPFSYEFKLRKICAIQLKSATVKIEEVEKSVPKYSINANYAIRRTQSDSSITMHSPSYVKVFHENNIVKSGKVKEAEDVINKLNNFYLPRKVI